MKKLVKIIILFILFPFIVSAQSDYFRTLYKERAMTNLNILAKDSLIKEYVNITDLGIEMYAHPNASKPEFTLYWYEAANYLKRMHNNSYFEFLEWYELKGNQRLSLSQNQRVLDFVRFLPDDISMLSVAIDPGHFAGNWEQALQEDKYIKVRASDAGTKKDIKFFEAQLNYATALILKDTLEKLGVHRVMITREEGVSPVGKDFNTWFKEDFEEETIRLAEKGEISGRLANRLLTKKIPYEAFKYVYNYLDFVKRSRMINDFKPDVTLIMHMNADEYGTRMENGYWTVTDVNYSMIFVPGSFLSAELVKKNARIEFIRLLLSPDLEESINLSKYLISDIEDNLGVPPMPVSYSSEMLENNCIEIENMHGIFARNLYMTRAVESPVLFVETLFMDNKEELIALNDQSVNINGIKTSKRVQEVAYTYLGALLEWMEDNKRSNKQWEEQTASK